MTTLGPKRGWHRGPTNIAIGASPNARNSGRFGDLSTFSLRFVENCAITDSWNERAAKRPQLIEANMQTERLLAEAAVRRARAI
jgi:hypothetical protein